VLEVVVDDVFFVDFDVVVVEVGVYEVFVNIGFVVD